MAKKSFFEKLTGSNWSDNETEEIPTSEELLEQIENIDETEESDQEEPKPKQEKQETNKRRFFMKKEKTKPNELQEDNKEILDESEGQLTIDVYQTPNEIVIKSTIAGVEPKDIDININNDMITIKGKRQKDEAIKEEDYYYQECYWGSFSRSVILPVDVEADSAMASMKNGILTVKLPKAERAKIKKISIVEE